jgi:flagellar protein FlaG
MSIERIAGGASAPAPVPMPLSSAPAASVPAAPPSPAELRVAVDNVNRYLKSIDQGVQFEIDAETGRTVVRVVDKETHEVIRQLPTEEMLAVARAIARMKGLLLNDKA